MGSEKRDTKFTRRHFLYLMGSAAGVALGGWVLDLSIKEADMVEMTSSAGASLPCLRSGLTIIPTESGAEIFENGRGEPVCGVNRIGLRVLEQLNGKKTVEELASDMRSYTSEPDTDLEKIQSNVARFIAELGSAGLLRDPFYVNIYNREVTG